jgi:hypothetical protein
MPYRQASPPAPLPDDAHELERFRRHLRGSIWGHVFVALAGLAITCGSVVIVKNPPAALRARPACSYAKHTLPTGEAFVERRCGDDVTQHYLHDPREHEL